MEVPIIATSLVSITDDLHGFDQAGWVVTGYLLTYAGRTLLESLLIAKATANTWQGY